jgi:hypothetical protein
MTVQGNKPVQATEYLHGFSSTVVQESYAGPTSWDNRTLGKPKDAPLSERCLHCLPARGLGVIQRLGVSFDPEAVERSLLALLGSAQCRQPA